MAARNTLRRSLLYGRSTSIAIAYSPHFNAELLDHEANKPFTKPVPGSSQRFLDKSRSLAADCVAYDLEDSVTPHMKVEARGLVRRAIDQPVPAGIRERAVRINSVDSGLALGDLTEVVSSSRCDSNPSATANPK
jgi:hypothetical protein